jgi:hypothetical protein
MTLSFSVKKKLLAQATGNCLSWLVDGGNCCIVLWQYPRKNQRKGLYALRYAALPPKQQRLFIPLSSGR